MFVAYIYIYIRFDTGKLMLAVNMYTCLIKEDQIEKDRKTINT